MPNESALPGWKDWIFHPVRTSRIVAAVNEHRRSLIDGGAIVAGHRDRPSNTERWVQVGAARRSARTVRRAAKKIAKLAQRYLALRDAADDHRLRAGQAQQVVYISGHRPGRKPSGRIRVTAYSGRPVTAVDARDEIEKARDVIERQTREGLSRHLHSPSRVAVLLAYLLLFVDVAALFISTGSIFNVSFQHPEPVPLVIAAVFSVVGAGVTAKIALVMGQHLWAWRQSGSGGAHEVPPRSGLLLLCVAVLSLLSLLSGLSIWTRIHEEAALVGAPGLGAVLGSLVGFAGAVAPWIIVLQELDSGSVETRHIAALTPIVDHASRQERADMFAARTAEKAADRIGKKAEQLFVDTVHRVGDHQLRADEIILVARSLHGQNGLHPEDVDIPQDWSSPMAALATRLATDLRPLQNALSHMNSERVGLEAAPARPGIAGSSRGDRHEIGS